MGAEASSVRPADRQGEDITLAPRRSPRVPKVVEVTKAVAVGGRATWQKGVTGQAQKRKRVQAKKGRRAKKKNHGSKASKDSKDEEEEEEGEEVKEVKGVEKEGKREKKTEISPRNDPEVKAIMEAALKKFPPVKRGAKSEEEYESAKVQRMVELFTFLFHQAIPVEEARFERETAEREAAARGQFGKHRKAKKVSRRPDLKAMNWMDAWGESFRGSSGKKDKVVGMFPGVKVGQEFRWRALMKVVGVHTSHMCGIDFQTTYSKETKAEQRLALSVCVSGNYEDDEDNGDLVTYTGDGGNDLLGTSTQRDHQKLTPAIDSLRNACGTDHPIRLFRKRQRTVGEGEGGQQGGEGGSEGQAGEGGGGSGESCAGTYFTYDGLYRVVAKEEPGYARELEAQEKEKARGTGKPKGGEGRGEGEEGKGKGEEEKGEERDRNREEGKGKSKGKGKGVSVSIGEVDKSGVGVGKKGLGVFKFFLERLPGQGPTPEPIVGGKLSGSKAHKKREPLPAPPKSVEDVDPRHLVCADLSNGLEALRGGKGIVVTNAVDPIAPGSTSPPGPDPFTYITERRVAEGFVPPFVRRTWGRGGNAGEQKPCGARCGEGWCRKKKGCGCDCLHLNHLGEMPYQGTFVTSGGVVLVECSGDGSSSSSSNNRSSSSGRGPAAHQGCPCSPSSCPLRLFSKGLQYQLEVFKTAEKGWGVRSWDHIYQGAVVMEYQGELLDDSEAANRGENDMYVLNIEPRNLVHHDWERAHLERIKDEFVPNPEFRGGEGLRHAPWALDAFHFGNVTRFVNHSCNPNLQWQYVVSKEHPCLARKFLVATCHIPPMKELTYDYNYAIGEVYDEKGNQKSLACHCNEANCKRRLY